MVNRMTTVQSINHRLDAIVYRGGGRRIDLNRIENEKRNYCFRWNECDYLHKSCPIEWKNRKFVQIINYNLHILVFVLLCEWPDWRSMNYCRLQAGRRHQTHGIFMAIDYLFKCITDSAHRTFFAFAFGCFHHLQ